MASGPLFLIMDDSAHGLQRSGLECVVNAHFGGAHDRRGGNIAGHEGIGALGRE